MKYGIWRCEALKERKSQFVVPPLGRKGLASRNGSASYACGLRAGLRTDFPQEAFFAARSIRVSRTDQRSVCSACRQAWLGSPPVERRAGSVFQRERLSGGRPDSGRRAGRKLARRADRFDESRSPRAAPLLRISLERIERPDEDTLSRVGRMAHQARLSRHSVASGLHSPGFTTPGRRGAVLARPVVLQAGASRRSSRVASGLFLLDAHDAAGAPDVLDRA